MGISPETSVLLLIDLQQRLMPAITGHELVVANARRLAMAARMFGIPVLATEQNPDGLGPNVASVKEFVDRTLTKQNFDATREAAWTSFLPVERPNIIVAGCEAHVCVLQTVMGMRKTGAPVFLVADTIGSRLTSNRDAAIHRAEHFGAEIVTAEMVLFEWLGSAGNPHFRDVIRLIK